MKYKNTTTKNTKTTKNNKNNKKGKEMKKTTKAKKTTKTKTTCGKWAHPFIGKRVLVRTYSAGVHIGTLVSVNPDNAMECHIKDALRLWKWENGGLSLSAIAHNGIKGGRVNKTDEVVLTGAIEYIPTTPQAEESFLKFVED